MVLGVGKGTPLCIDAFELVEEIPSRHDPDQTYAYSLWRGRERPRGRPGDGPRLVGGACRRLHENFETRYLVGVQYPENDINCPADPGGTSGNLVAAAEIGSVVPQLAE